MAIDLAYLAFFGGTLGYAYYKGKFKNPVRPQFRKGSFESVDNLKKRRRVVKMQDPATGTSYGVDESTPYHISKWRRGPGGRNDEPLDNIGAGVSAMMTGLVPRLEQHPGIYLKVGRYKKYPAHVSTLGTTWRWQSLSAQPEIAGSLGLYALGDKSGVDSTTNAFTIENMPVFAFNMTCLPNGQALNQAGTASSSGVYQCPAYQLQKKSWSTSPATVNYAWKVAGGSHNLPGTDTLTPAAYVAPYQLMKKSELSQAVNSAPESYRHCYTKAKIMMYGATTRPVKVEVTLVKFKKGFAPDRYIATLNTTAANAAAGTLDNYDTDALDGRDLSRHDAYWDYYLSKRIRDVMHVTHPPSNMGRNFTVLSKRVYTICQPNTTDVNSTVCRCLADVMLKSGQYYNLMEDTKWAELQGQYYVPSDPFNPAPNDGNRFGYKYEGYGGSIQWTNMLQNHTEDVWMLVTGVGESITFPFGAPSTTYTTAPSFDIILETKVETPKF